MDINQIKGHIPFFTELKLKEIELDAVRSGFSEEIRIKDRLIKELESEISRLETSVLDEQVNISKAERSFGEKLKLKQEGYNRLLAEYNLASIERKESESKLVEGMSDIMASVEREAKIQLEMIRQERDRSKAEVESYRAVAESAGMTLARFENDVLRHISRAKEQGDNRIDTMRLEVEAVKAEIERLKKAIVSIAEKNISLEDDLGARTDEREKLKGEMSRSKERYETEIERINLEYTYKAEDLTRRNEFFSEQSRELKQDFEKVSEELRSAKKRIEELTERSDAVVDKLENRVRLLAKQLGDSKTAAQEAEFHLCDVKREFEVALKSHQDGYAKLVSENSDLLEKTNELEKAREWQNDKWAVELEGLMKELEDMRARKQVSDSEKVELEKKLSLAEERIFDSKRDVEEFHEKIKRLNHQIVLAEESRVEELGKARSSCFESLMRAEMAEQERDSYRESFKMAESRREFLQRELAKVHESIDSMSEENVNLRAQVVHEKTEKSALQITHNHLLENFSRIQNELDETKRIVIRLRGENESNRIDYESKEVELQETVKAEKIEVEKLKRVLDKKDWECTDRLLAYEKEVARISELHAIEIENIQLEKNSLKNQLEESQKQLISVKDSFLEISEQLGEILIREEDLKIENKSLHKLSQIHMNQLAYISHELDSSSS